MALEYDGCGNYKHSAVCYILVRGADGNKHIPIKDAKPFPNNYGLDLFLVTKDVYAEDGKRKLTSAGSLVEGITGLKLCDSQDLEKCINTRGLKAVEDLIFKMQETYGWSPRYLNPGEKKSDVFPQAEVDEEDKCILVAPLFVDGMFNRGRKRMRAKFLRTVCDEEVSYDLYISGSKTPDNTYAASDDDRYYLYAWLNGWLVPLGMTERFLRKHATMQAVTAALYGDEQKREEFFDNLRNNNSWAEAEQLVSAQIKTEEAQAALLAEDGKLYAAYIKDRLDERICAYRDGRPDFIGAAVVNDLDNCIVLAEQRRIEDAQKRYQRQKQEEERERQDAEERAAKEAKRIVDAESAIRQGGEKLMGCDLLCALADKYNVSIPIKTRGWILRYFVSYEAKPDSSVTVRYMAKNSHDKGSSKIYEIIDNIREAVIAAA